MRLLLALSAALLLPAHAFGQSVKQVEVVNFPDPQHGDVSAVPAGGGTMGCERHAGSARGAVQAISSWTA